jgi:hypothetical protein
VAISYMYKYIYFLFENTLYIYIYIYIVRSKCEPRAIIKLVGSFCGKLVVIELLLYLLINFHGLKVKDCSVVALV